MFYEDRYCEACKGHWRATVRVEHQGPRVMRTEVVARVVLVCVSTKDSKLFTGSTNLIWMVVD